MRWARNGKYNSVRTSCLSGHQHASAMEAGDCNTLSMLQKAREISELTQQPNLKLDTVRGNRFGYRPDFSYRWKEWPHGLVYRDTKGAITPKMKSVMAAWPKFGPAGSILLVVGKGWSKQIEGPKTETQNTQSKGSKK